MSIKLRYRVRGIRNIERLMTKTKDSQSKVVKAIKKSTSDLGRIIRKMLSARKLGGGK